MGKFNHFSHPLFTIKPDIWIKSVTFDNWMEFAFHKMLNDIW